MLKYDVIADNTKQDHTMKCPCCKEDLKLGLIPELNMLRYGKACLVATECCKRAVVARPVFSYTVHVYDGADTVDDWGTEFKK